MRSTATIVVAIAAQLALCGTGALGHDLRGLLAEQTALDPEAREKIEELRELKRFLAARSAAMRDRALEAVVQTATTWPEARASVCFFDGSKEARDHVAEIAAKWTTTTSLQLDFGETGNRRTCDPLQPNEIRVSFQAPGHWSYVGTQSKLISPDKPTLNLHGMDRADFTDQDDGIILHEFGHAIGFEHEHQSPIGGCDAQFNWDYLYTSLGWSKADVDRNMKQLNTSSSATGLLTTSFDPKSIMLYSLDPRAFLDAAHASCYVAGRNTSISSVDRKAAETVYPSLATLQPPGSLRTPIDPGQVPRELRRLQELIGGPSAAPR